MVCIFLYVKGLRSKANTDGTDETDYFINSVNIEKREKDERIETKTGKTPSDVCDSRGVFVPSAVPLSLRTSSYVKGTIFGTSLCYYKPQKEKTAVTCNLKNRLSLQFIA